MGNAKILVNLGSPFQKLKMDNAEAMAGSMLNQFFQVTMADTIPSTQNSTNHRFPCAHFLSSFRKTVSRITPMAPTADRHQGKSSTQHLSPHLSLIWKRDAATKQHI